MSKMMTQTAERVPDYLSLEKTARLRYTRVFRECRDSPKYITVSRGGTRSSKTWSVCQLAVLWLINDWPGTVWSITRKTFPALKATAYRDFVDIINGLGLMGRIKHLKSPGNYTFTYGAKMVEFFSLDDEVKIRSRKRDILFICEANEVGYDVFIQLLIRTRRKIFLDLNPSITNNNWVKDEIEDHRMLTKGDVDIVKSTYMDNPFLTQDEVDNITYLKDIDEELWNIFGLGEWGKMTGLIFPSFTLIDQYPEDDIIHVGEITTEFLGLDFGFSIHPAAVIRVGRKDSRLYLDEWLYATKLTNHDLAERIKDRDDRPSVIVADSAEPKSIAELRAEHLRIVPAVKGKDSIYQGILYMKTFELCVTKASVNLIKELNNYKWDKDKPNTPVDAFNHGIDAVRYVVQTKLKKAAGLKVGGTVGSYRNDMRR